MAPYTGAPYNFVPFTKKIVSREKEHLVPHNKASQELLSGEISYTIKAKTPIIIDNGIDSTKPSRIGGFYKNAEGKTAIPGSSVRGLIKSNAQILSLSSVSDDIDDYALMYRNVASGADKKRYQELLGNDTITVTNPDRSEGSLSVLMNVRAGYVRNEKGVYKIYDTHLDAVPQDNFTEKSKYWNYYILSERHIADEYVKNVKNGGNNFAFPFFIKNENPTEFKTMHCLDSEFQKNEFYKPYAEPCLYKVSGRRVESVCADSEELLENDSSYEKGYAVSSGFMKMKKAIYIIPEVDYDKKADPNGMKMPIEISQKDLKAFRIDLKKRETTLENFGGRDAFDLPQKNGEIKPIFYIYIGERLYFGFTPRLRLFYDYTVKKGIPNAQNISGLDFAKVMFGFSDKDKGESYKSRVSFLDATLKEKPAFDGRKKAILGEPKPTSYQDYLLPEDNQAVTYNNKDFQLRGVKQYWLRNQVIENVPKGKDKKDYVQKWTPLKSESVFEGKVRFHNLTEIELGLLLWSMELESNSEMNIGKAKSCGYGRIKLNISDVKKMNLDDAYGSIDLNLDPFSPINKMDLIGKYKAFLKEQLGLEESVKLECEEPIKSFLVMKTMIPDKEDIKFMSLSDYQNREMLKSVWEMFLHQKEKEKENGAEIVCEVLKVRARKVEFADKCIKLYGNFKYKGEEDIKSKFKEGMKVKVKSSGVNDNGKTIWEFVDIVE